MNTRLYKILLVCSLALSAFVFAAENIQIEDATILLSPPGIKSKMGTLNVINTGSVDRKIIQISSDVFDSIDIHKTEIVDGIATMRMQHSILVPAGQSIRFQHGSYHLMLNNPKYTLIEGEKVELIMQIDDEKIHIKATVSRM